MSTCQQEHRYSSLFESLPEDQANSSGRHKCAGCAYEEGYKAGLSRAKIINIEDAIRHIPDSQAGTVRHKSPVAAFSLGYKDGMEESYR